MLIVTDSNRKGLRLGQIKPEAKVTRVIRYTTQSAIDSMPNINDPLNVTDIVFQVGYNDSRKGFSPKEIQDKYLSMQMHYNQSFPNARQHVTALPPTEKNHIDVNLKLQKLSQYTGSNFITTKTFLDRNTGKIRSNVMDGIHYNEWGIKMIAKQIKKSLYSTANRENGHFALLQKVNGTNSSHPNVQKTNTIPLSTSFPLQFDNTATSIPLE